MPNPSKGPRLWLRPERDNERSTWVIRDGAKQRRTRCAPGEIEKAEQALAAYIADKHQPPQERGRNPSAVEIADVLNIYHDHATPRIARPEELKQRLAALSDFFTTKTLADINGALCRAYATQRGSDSMARRELEDLRAAIVHHRKEGLCNAVVEIVLPPKSLPRERWLTRSEAAKMIWAAWRYREVQKGKATGRASRKHIARFMLVGLYTGTRSSAICGAAVGPAIGRGYVDLDAGVFYRRPAGEAETKKRRPTIRIPDRLLAHMRRWAAKRISVKSVVEFGGEPIKGVRKAFARVARDAGLDGVTPHVLRHTAVTWAMQNGGEPYDTADFFGMTLDVLQSTYGHHHPDHQKGVGEAVTRRPGSAQVGRNKR